MGSPATVDIDALLHPVPGDNPAGDAVPFGTRKTLDDARKEIFPEAFAPDDPLRPENPKLAEWDKIIRVSQETLTDASKDLLVAARLTEALTKSHGFAGLRDGFRLLRRLIEEAWDRINPTIDDGDLEVRATAFNWLDDPDRGSRFPMTVRQVAFIQGDDGAFSWQTWRDTQDGRGKVQRESLDQAIGLMSWQKVQDLADDLEEAKNEIDLLLRLLTDKMGDVAPGLSQVNLAIGECESLVRQILSRKGPPPVSESPVSAEESGAMAVAAPAVGVAMTPATWVAPPRALVTREDVYAQLAEISDKLLRMDPHSPITYLVQRAVKLSRLTFPQLMKILIRDASILGDLNRELDLGIKDDEGGDHDRNEERE